MRILITGGSGFLGRSLIARALAAGHEVTNFDQVEYEPLLSGYRMFKGDIRDKDSVRQAMAECEGVIHNAAAVPLAKNRDAFHTVNVLGTECVLSVAMKLDMKKIVFVSSSAVNGATPRVLDTSIPHPFEPYGESKWQAEKICLRYCEKGLDITRIRPATILGSARRGLFGLLFHWVQEGLRIPVLGDGANAFQFVDGEDLAEACLLALSRPGSALYLAGAPDAKSLTATLQDLIQYAGTGAKIWHIPKHPTEELVAGMSWMRLLPFATYQYRMYSQGRILDCSKTEQQLGWRPRTKNTECLVQSYRAFVEGGGQNEGLGVHQRSLSSPLLKWAELFLKQRR